MLVDVLHPGEGHLGSRRAADQTVSTCLKLFFLLLLPVGAAVVLNSDAISVHLLDSAPFPADSIFSDKTIPPPDTLFGKGGTYP